MSNLNTPDAAAEAGRYAASAVMARRPGATVAQTVVAGAFASARILSSMAGNPAAGVGEYVDADCEVSPIVDRAIDSLTSEETDEVMATLSEHWSEINHLATTLAF